MGLIPNAIIDAVIDRTDIAAVVGRYVQLKKAGRNFKALCPFHREKTPSFVVNPDKQIFHCFGCGAGGNAIAFIMRQERLEFPHAVRFLADQYGISIPDTTSEAESPSRQLRDSIYRVNELTVDFFHQLLLTSRLDAAKAAREYLKGRGVALETVNQFKLGFAPDDWEALSEFLKTKGISDDLMQQAGLVIARENKRGFYDRFRNRVIFPIFDIQARPIAFGARALKDAEGAKYINSPETPVYTKGRHLYGFHLTKAAVGKLDYAIVVEGYMDMIMPFVHGVENIAASLGTALTPEQINLIRRFTPNVVMLFDTDLAGQNAIVRSLDLLVDAGMNVRVATLSDGQDPDSFIRLHGVRAFEERLSKAASLFDFKLAWLKTQHDVKSIEGKARVSKQMLETIMRFSDEVVKSELIKKLSEDLNIDKDAVLRQSKPFKSRAESSPQQPMAVVPATVALSLKDEIFLGILLSDPQWAPKARDEITPEDFPHPLVRTVVAGIWELSGRGQEWTGQDVLKNIKDHQAQELVARLMSRDEAWLGDKDIVFKDCVAGFRKKRWHVQKEEQKRSGDFESAVDIIRKIKQ